MTISSKLLLGKKFGNDILWQQILLVKDTEGDMAMTQKTGFYDKSVVVPRPGETQFKATC
jgi:hypothetical protein